VMPANASVRSGGGPLRGLPRMTTQSPLITCGEGGGGGWWVLLQVQTMAGVVYRRKLQLLCAASMHGARGGMHGKHKVGAGESGQRQCRGLRRDQGAKNTGVQPPGRRNTFPLPPGHHHMRSIALAPDTEKGNRLGGQHTDLTTPWITCFGASAMMTGGRGECCSEAAPRVCNRQRRARQ